MGVFKALVSDLRKYVAGGQIGLKKYEKVSKGGGPLVFMPLFLAVQDSSIGDIITHSLIKSASQTFDFSVTIAKITITTTIATITTITTIATIVTITTITTVITVTTMTTETAI